MGSVVTMTVLQRDRAAGELALDAAFAELERVENVMSLYRPESEISRLNRAGVLKRPDPYLVEVLRFAREISASSDGAFDVTVQPLWSLHAAALKEGRQPDAEAVSEARRRVGWRQVEAEPELVLLHGEGTAITLNGIAQGFAADVVLRTLRAHDVRHALIDTGELGAMGRNAEGAAWTVGIQHPRRQDAFATVTRLEDRCMATSGDYQTAFNADFSRHHVFDPATGVSPGVLASVSVVAPTGMAADAFSTTLMVMGAERGMEWLATFADADALLIFKDGRRTMTPGFPVIA